MLIAVISVKGSPGVTTFSVALAACWPGPAARVLLVEADPSGGDVATRFSLASTPGVASLAAAARRSTDPGLAWQHAQALPGGLAVVTTSPDADQARAALTALVPDATAGVGVVRRAADAVQAVVIADCGRIDPESPSMPIVRSADVLIVLSRAGADDLAHLARRLPAVGGWSPCPVLLLVGAGYSIAEVARELGVPPAGRIPEDRHGAAALCGRRSGSRWGRRGPSHSGLGRAAHHMATTLLSHLPDAAGPKSAGPVAPPLAGGPVEQPHERTATAP